MVYLSGLDDKVLILITTCRRRGGQWSAITWATYDTIHIHRYESPSLNVLNGNKTELHKTAIEEKMKAFIP